jgi:RimJ/RimL family protein N-acetyltransferase
VPEFRLETERLILRDWREDDLDALHRINSDPLVMATIGPLQDRDASRVSLGRLMARTVNDGHTLWALERRSDGRVIGFCGIVTGTVPQIKGELEIGWRLASDCWGQSYAREAAEAAIRWFAANRPGQRLCAITLASNTRSRGLMERLGMRRDPLRDFGYAGPGMPEGAPLKPHVTYWLDEPG